MRELAELQTNPPEGIRVTTSEDNMLDVSGIIQGPGAFRLGSPAPDCSPACVFGSMISEGTPYAGGYFTVKFKFTEQFPAAPPKCTHLLPAHGNEADSMFDRLVRD